MRTVLLSKKRTCLSRAVSQIKRTHDLARAAVMFALSLLFFTQPLVVFKPAYFLLITANGLFAGPYMWLLFVRNGECGAGREKRVGCMRFLVEIQLFLRAYKCVCVRWKRRKQCI